MTLTRKYEIHKEIFFMTDANLEDLFWLDTMNITGNKQTTTNKALWNKVLRNVGFNISMENIAVDNSTLL